MRHAFGHKLQSLRLEWPFCLFSIPWRLFSIYFCLSDFSGEYICGMRENNELIKEDFFMRFVLECVFMSLSAMSTAQTITVIYLKQIWQRFMARNWQHALDLNQMR